MASLSSSILCFFLLLLLLLSMSCIIESNFTMSSYIVFTTETSRPSTFQTQGEWHSSMISSLTNQSYGSNSRIFYAYGTVFNGFAARLTTLEAEKIKKMPGVSAMFEDTLKTRIHTTRSPWFLGLNENNGLWPEARFGDDIIIGLVDSGIWPESASFKDEGLGPILDWKGSCEFESSLCNNKLIGAKVFTTGYQHFLADTSVKDVGGDYSSPRDGAGHGTHTASIAAGASVSDANIFGFADGTAKGIAVNAKLAMYKACVVSSCAESDILAAMESAIQDGVHILSLSIGGPEDPHYNNAIARGAFAAVSRGIFVVCSAGNNGPIPYSVENTAPWITTVGAGGIDRKFPVYIILGNGEGFVGSSLYVSSSTTTSESYTIVYVDDCGTVDSVLQNLEAKILVCAGDPSKAFDVGLKVQKAGGTGFILLNLVNLGEGLLALPFTLHAAVVGFNEGLSIRNYISTTENPTASFIFSNATAVGNERAPVVAAFSARGPNSMVPEVLKPDLIAPGINILGAFAPNIPPTFSSNDQRRVNFNIMSGTSMACPHVAGAAALLLAVHPDWSPAAIRSALMTTAGTTDNVLNPIARYEDMQSATALDVGAGHIIPQLAADPGLVYDANVSDYINFMCSLNYAAGQVRLFVETTDPCLGNNAGSPADLNYPSISVVLRENTNSRQLKRTVTNVGGFLPETYTVQIVNPEFDKVTISVDPGSLTFTNVLEKQSFVVKIIGSGRYIGETVSGYIAWQSDKHVVRSPFVITWE